MHLLTVVQHFHWRMNLGILRRVEANRHGKDEWVCLMDPLVLFAIGMEDLLGVGYAGYIYH